MNCVECTDQMVIRLPRRRQHGSIHESIDAHMNWIYGKQNRIRTAVSIKRMKGILCLFFLLFFLASHWYGSTSLVGCGGENFFICWSSIPNNNKKSQSVYDLIKALKRSWPHHHAANQVTVGLWDFVRKGLHAQCGRPAWHKSAPTDSETVESWQSSQGSSRETSPHRFLSLNALFCICEAEREKLLMTGLHGTKQSYGKFQIWAGFWQKWPYQETFRSHPRLAL